MTRPTSHHTAPAATPAPAAAFASPTESSSAPGSQSKEQNDTRPRTSAMPISTADAGDASDDNSAPASPVREIPPGPSAEASSRSMDAKTAPPPLQKAGFPRTDADPLPLPPVTQEIFLALGADPG
jgi:hypothetical protein